MSHAEDAEPWHKKIIRVLKANGVDLITYIPDNVLRDLIQALHDDPHFTVICPAREEEAVGIVAGAYLAGRKGVVLMQTSGFATLPNVLASLAVPFQIPIVMVISERGILGEFQLGQAIVCRTMRPVLQALGIEYHAIEDRSHVEFVADGLISQAFATKNSAAIILSPLLTKRAH